MANAGLFDAATGFMGSLFNAAGGFLQAGELRKATERRLEQMRRQADASIGKSTAQAAASGVEMTSGTVQNHLQTLRGEWNKAIGQVQSAGSDAESYAMLNGMGSAFQTFAGGMSKYAQSSEALGEDPLNGAFQGMPETSPGVKTPSFDWAY